VAIALAKRHAPPLYLYLRSRSATLIYISEYFLWNFPPLYSMLVLLLVSFPVLPRPRYRGRYKFFWRTFSRPLPPVSTASHLCLGRLGAPPHTRFPMPSHRMSCHLTSKSPPPQRPPPPLPPSLIFPSWHEQFHFSQLRGVFSPYSRGSFP